MDSVLQDLLPAMPIGALVLCHSPIYGFAAASEPWAPARGLVPPLARQALTGAAGAGDVAGDNPKIKVWRCTSCLSRLE